MNVPPQTGGAPAKGSSGLNILGRVLLVALTIGAFGLVWWSVNRLLPLQAQYNNLTAQILHLEYKVEQMDSAQGRQELETAESRFNQSYQDSLATQEEVASWVDLLKETALPLGLGLEIEFGKPVPQAGEDQNLANLAGDVGIGADRGRPGGPFRVPAGAGVQPSPGNAGQADGLFATDGHGPLQVGEACHGAA